MSTVSFVLYGFIARRMLASLAWASGAAAKTDAEIRRTRAGVVREDLRHTAAG